MRALAYRGPGRLELEERPDPEPGDGEAVLRVEACSICGTDLRIAAGSHRAYADALGRVPGHEIVGVVTATGRGAAVEEGARVFVAPNYGCGRCRACLRGDVNLCERPRAVGISEDGGFAEQMRLPRELVEQGNLLPLANGADPGAAAIAEPLACALRGFGRARVEAGDRVVVFGAGPVGLMHVALAREAAAAEILVCEPNAERLERAAAWGATASYVDQAAVPEGADAVIVAAPAASAQQRALELAAPGGRVIFFAGLPRGASRVELDTNLVHYKELVVTGTTASTNAECRDALGLILAGRVDTGALIDARLGLEAAREAFALAGSGRALKVVIEP
jgi:L-iditol 2-dehydrogenase